jgi:hypothetical protein
VRPPFDRSGSRLVGTAFLEEAGCRASSSPVEVRVGVARVSPRRTSAVEHRDEEATMYIGISLVGLLLLILLLVWIF